jgi:hypothetical protein
LEILHGRLNRCSLSSFNLALALAGHASQDEIARRNPADDDARYRSYGDKTPATMRAGDVDRCAAQRALDLALLP